MKIFNKIQDFTLANEMRTAGLYPYFNPRTKHNTDKVHNDILLDSNNYLGLANHPDVLKNSMQAIQKDGSSCTGSRFLNGTLHCHLALEKALASFFNMQEVQTFTTGYQANVGVLSALAGKGDYIVLDKEAHASIIDGAMLATAKGAQILRFKHNDIAHLRKVLSKVPKEAGCVVVVDGVYSMSGELVKLPEISQLCKAQGACLIVDDAHGVGVFGKQGRGTVNHFDLEDQVDLITGTFSKSFASVGGFVAGKSDVIDYIRHHARALIFSASMPANAVAAAHTSLEIMLNEPQRIARLQRNADYMRQGLAALGFDIGQSVSPIIPIFIRNEVQTFVIWKKLKEQGVYTNPVVPPGVTTRDCMLRTSYMASHSIEELNRALSIFAKVGLELGLIQKQKAVA
jgi:8-amino-7-oxononanoate synthase